MHLSVTFHIASTTRENEGTWGEMEVKDFLREFPILSSLVTALSEESGWSEAEGEPTWTARFQVEKGVTKSVSLKMVSCILTLYVPPIRINLEKPPTLHEIETYILRNLWDASVVNTLLEDEDENEPTPEKPIWRM